MIPSYTKRTLSELLSAVAKLHSLAERSDSGQLIPILTKAQELMIRFGTTVEQESLSDRTGEPALSEKGTALIPVLEQYAEDAYRLAEHPALKSEVLPHLQDAYVAAASFLEQEHTRYLVLFLPYKASMWDCMESVYLACASDPRMEARVMPIPYLALPEGGGELTMFLETDYPENIPLTDCKTYSLTAMRPDACFIHNPYDNSNYVTSVHPMFYSEELKKVSRLLIYLPYFASPNGLSEGQSHMPAYRNIDYWIVTSEAYRESAKENPYYGKMVPLGSPKYDRVLRLTREGCAPPKDWGVLPEKKTRVLLSTTIGWVLQDTSLALQNLREAFDFFREQDDFLLVWRPHPLLTDTFRSLRTDRLREWEAICEYFKKEKIGIFDTSPDISVAVAATDAEIDDGSSIRCLYIITEKPTWYFPLAPFNTEELSAFLQKVSTKDIAELLRAQGEMLSPWVTNSDGTCGKHIHEWLYQKLEGL